MKTEDIKGYLIFMVWILWFQRNSLLVETIPNGSAFHKHSSPVLNVQPTFYWNGGLGVLSSMNVCLECRGSWGLSHQNCQRWDDVSSLWEVAFKGRHLRCEEKQKAWVRILSITHAFKQGNEERARILSFLLNGLLSSWNQPCLYVGTDDRFPRILFPLL